MFEHILVPLDGSSLAEKALKPAVEIAKSLQSKLTLLRVVPQFSIVAADPTLYEEMNRMGEDESLAYLRAVAFDLQLGDQVEIIGETGQPADVIINFAEAHDVDLIMMSSHGRSGLSRWVYGSVAERVLRGAPCHTAIINARVEECERHCSKILVPLDGSQISERALQPAQKLADAMNGKIYLYQVIPTAHQIFETESMTLVFDSEEDKDLEAAGLYLGDKASEFAGIEVSTFVEIEKDSIAENIIEYAADKEIDMIVMSSHGRTGLKRWVYGSVAEKVLRSACCATMIIR